MPLLKETPINVTTISKHYNKKFTPAYHALVLNQKAASACKYYTVIETQGDECIKTTLSPTRVCNRYDQSISALFSPYAGNMQLGSVQAFPTMPSRWQTIVWPAVLLIIGFSALLIKYHIVVCFLNGLIKLLLSTDWRSSC